MNSMKFISDVYNSIPYAFSISLNVLGIFVGGAAGAAF